MNEFGQGFSGDTLKNARKFYLIYKERISETVFSLLAIENNSSLYERIALSKDKSGVLRLSSEGNVIAKPQDIIK